MYRASKIALIVAAWFSVSRGGTVEQTICPPIALSLVLDGSGSIGWKNVAVGPCNAFGTVCQGEPAMEYFAKSILDAVQAGPKGTKSQYAAIEFDHNVNVLSSLKEDYIQVKNDLAANYKVGGGTNILKGIVEGHNELKKAPADLAKVMIVISDGDGSDSKTARIAAADAAKADNVTIFAFGFNGIQADKLSAISGNKDGTCGADCNRVASGGLTELTNFIETGLCKTIITVVPPTPAPTPACKVPKESNQPGSVGENKDEEWTDCLGDLCKRFPYANGSSTLCLQEANAGACDDPVSPYYAVCSCTCGRCCEPTPEPTPAPTDTDSPTPQPTPEPTFPDCNPDFELPLAKRSNWLAAKEVLVDFFQNCNYDFDLDWQKLVDDYRVKVIRNGITYAYDGPDGIAKTPYEELTLHICMPTDFPSRTCKNGGGMMESSANQKFSKAWVSLFGTLLLFLAAKE